MRLSLILIAALIAFGPIAALAQSSPPLPRPRPDRENVPAQRIENSDGQTAIDAIADLPLPDGPPQPVTLSAKVSSESPILPGGVTWRIFEPHADADGQMALLAKSSNPVAVFDLKPGDYVVHVSYGRSQASDTIRVETAPSSRTIVMDSGGLRLNAAIDGDIQIPTAQLTFDIYASDGVRQEGPVLADDVSPGEIVYLNAGVYHIVSQYGSMNAEVRTNLRVDPGQLTDAILYHHASPVSFRLVSESGGEAIADVDWTVRTADGAILLTHFGAFPSAILAEGEYVVLAKRGDNVYNRDFQVRPGTGTQIEVLTSVY